MCGEVGFSELDAALAGGVVFAQSTQFESETQAFVAGAATRIGENAPGRAGRPRRMLSVTPVGVEALRRARGAWMALWDGMEGRLEEA